MNEVKPLIADRVTVGVDTFYGTDEEAKTVELAMLSYGHLLKVNTAVTRFSFAQFADVIEMHYSIDEPRTAQVVATLRALHERLALKAHGIESYCQQICGGGECGSGPVCQFGINPQTEMPGVRIGR